MRCVAATVAAAAWATIATSFALEPRHAAAIAHGAGGAFALSCPCAAAAVADAAGIASAGSASSSSAMASRLRCRLPRYAFRMENGPRRAAAAASVGYRKMAMFPSPSLSLSSRVASLGAMDTVRPIAVGASTPGAGLDSSDYSDDEKPSNLTTMQRQPSLSAASLVGVKSVGVDYGTVRTGVALTSGYAPRPLLILSNTNATEVATEVVRIASTERASRIVLGLPLDKNGTETGQARLTRDFASLLAQTCVERFGPPPTGGDGDGLNGPSFEGVFFWDERYTSREAAARVQNSDPKGYNSWTLVDAESASILLEDYYRRGGDGAELVQVPEEAREACLAAWEARRREAEEAREILMEGREASLRARGEAMRRARLLEEEMARDGTLGTGRKKKKRKKKSKKKKKTSGDKWIPL